MSDTIEFKGEYSEVRDYFSKDLEGYWRCSKIKGLVPTLVNRIQTDFPDCDLIMCTGSSFYFFKVKFKCNADEAVFIFKYMQET